MKPWMPDDKTILLFMKYREKTGFDVLWNGRTKEITFDGAKTWYTLKEAIEKINRALFL
jgi:hypothetical protein